MDRAGLRHHRSASGGERLIGLFSFSPPLSTAAAPSDELNEAEVCFADDFSNNEINQQSSATTVAETSGINRNRRHLFSQQLQHSGILGALPSTTSSKKVPASRPVRDHSKSAASAPVSVPVLSSTVAARRKISALVEEDEDVDDDEMLPPHEILARRSGQSTYSMLEGVGRTLKGRDLRQLRQEYSLCRVYKQSKSLRAFDRRPTATSATHLPALLLHDTGPTVEAAAGSSRSLLEKPPEISETTMGSPDNSPSSHDAIVGALHGSHSSELAAGDEDDGTLIMDLDQLTGWFYGNSSQNTEEEK